jgi:hypothetical protein
MSWWLIYIMLVFHHLKYINIVCDILADKEKFYNIYIHPPTGQCLRSIIEQFIKIWVTLNILQMWLITFMFHYFFTHPKRLQLPQEIFTIGNVLLTWLCKVFVTWINFFRVYVQANLVVYMTMGNLSINQGVKAWLSR